MDKDTRNAIERATQRARRLLEEDFAAQLEGDFDVHRDGAVAAKAGKHLSARQAFSRERIVAAIEHKRAAGMSAADAARDYLRDAAFTALNRFVALKMLEARELVQECITKGEQSAGYREFCGMAPGLPLLPDSAGYRLYIESLFDELSTEVKVLFDRRDPSSVLWPKRATFEQVLEILNAAELAGVWGEDETIGWVYQFFNGQDERKKMREESQAPRNSRELAVRNQFFTPRYVVQFLTDNTLGRIWYEMRGTETALAERCEYMVRRPGEEFAPRAKKDPRDLRVLDPACGSGHFLLYAFDLLLAIYEEAHADPESPRSEATGKTLAEDYPSIDELRKAIPGLILAHNLHGVDIDARCAQIAQLALWMRAQKAYRDFGIGRADRAQIRRSNIVVAEPLVADEQIAKEFVAKLGDVELGRVFTSLAESLSLAGDMGLLLRVEQLVAKASARGKTGDLFAPPEQRISAIAARFARERTATNTRVRLFGDDAAQGLALLELTKSKFDAVVMNPPFGAIGGRAASVFENSYPTAGRNIYCAFVERARELLAANGRCGAITDRSFATKQAYEAFRISLIDAQPTIHLFADLGWDVLDANVETCAWVLASTTVATLFVNAGMNGTKVEAHLRADWHDTATCTEEPLASFRRMPFATFAYAMPATLRRAFRSTENDITAHLLRAARGMVGANADQLYRLLWEVPQASVGGNQTWIFLQKGSPYSPHYYPVEQLLRHDGGTFKTVMSYDAGRLTGIEDYGRAGLAYGKRTDFMYAYPMPAGCVFSVEGQAIFPAIPGKEWQALAIANSSAFQELINHISGQHKYHGYVNAAHLVRDIPDCSAEAKAIWLALREMDRHNELSPAFIGPASAFLHKAGKPLVETLATVAKTRSCAMQEAARLRECINERVRQHIGAERPFAGGPTFVDHVTVLFGASNTVQLEAQSIISFALGLAFGRWAPPESMAQATLTHDPFSAVSMKNLAGCRNPLTEGVILADDASSEWDIVTTLTEKLTRIYPSVPNAEIISSLERAADIHPDGLRQWLAQEFFGLHVARYSRSRRAAPIYWQLATSSASYSIWIYAHTLNSDTLFRAQREVVGGAQGKLGHEERRLERMKSEFVDGATATRRRHLAAQEALVDELRAFLEELKRVAPLWKPNLDDGVIINFAPLWRLVPQNKSWQKELKATWDALCEGKYDWAHLAMHLWPERVVPKCANDRSLAIAHGLEDVFWVEGTGGKWTARKTPTRSIDELVKERTSPAVKSALKSLLEAPVAGGAARKTKKGKANA